MIRPKKGKGVFQSFLVSGFSMMFVWYFFRPPWPMQSVLLSHLRMCRMEERITAFLFSKCSKIRLLTFDLYLAVEQLRVFFLFFLARRALFAPQPPPPPQAPLARANVPVDFARVGVSPALPVSLSPHYVLL